MSLSKRKLELLKANKNTEREDIRLAEEIDDDALQTARKDEIIRIRELIRETGREIHMLKGFIRFKRLGEKVKCGYMKTEHEVGFIVVDWFAKRFPGKVIVLGNEEESWVSIYTEEGVSHEKSGSLESTLDELKEELDMEKKKDFTEVWERYYESQYSERRKNEELFRKNMPKKYMKRAGNKVERKFESQILDDFE